jgi:AcrR family transcriptional regulator
MGKHEIKYEEIIKTAFNEWGKTMFCDTSLSKISSRMKMTKAAFYRYFDKKEDLLDSMEDHFLNDLFKAVFSLDYKTDNFNDFLYKYINCYINFYAKNPHYLYFYSTIVRKDSFLKKIKFKQITLKEKRFLNYFIKKSFLTISENDIASFIGYFYCTIFILIYKELMTKIKNKENIYFSDNEINKLTDIANEMIVKGFSIKKEHKIDFEAIEKFAAINESEILKRDKIFDAITIVVAKEGIWKASLKKVAESAEMSKSGFYFYFKNKEDMFSKMFYDEINRIYELVNNREVHFKNMNEKLYCNMIVESTYFLKDIRIVYFFDWLHFQKINFAFLKKYKKKLDEMMNKRFGFVLDAFLINKIRDYSLDIEFFASFINTQIVKEIIIKIFNRTVTDVTDMRKMYNLFLYGINFYLS